jgi:manganese transport protein
MAGQVIMQGFVGFTIPLWVRRLVTMAPALIVVAIGLNPTQSLVISQVVLSFILPIPVLALVIFTRRRAVMGSLVNRPLTSVLAVAASIIILALNALLLFETFGGKVPGLA